MPIDYLASLPGANRPVNTDEPQNTTGLTAGYDVPKRNPVTQQLETPKIPTKAMPGKLVSMKTNFRTLKYSGDMPNGGSSVQPYIQTRLDADWNNPNSNNYSTTAKFGNDKNLANLAVNDASALLGVYESIDTLRVGRFLENNRKGKTFTTNQRTLQFQNPKMEVGTTLNISPIDSRNDSILSQVWGRIVNSSGAIEYTRVYNDNKNLLQQVGVSGTGNHYDRAGSTPVTPFNLKYYHVVKNKPADKNRLVLLYNNKVATLDYRVNPNLDASAELAKLGITRDQNSLFNYVGGPTSTDRIQSTFIQRYDFTNAWNRFNKRYVPNPNTLLKYIPIDTSTLETPSNIIVDGPGTDPSALASITTVRQVDNTNTLRQTVDLQNVNVTAKKLKVLPPNTVLAASPAPAGYEAPNVTNGKLEHKVYKDTSFQEGPLVDLASVINRSKVLTYTQILGAKDQDSIDSPQIKPDFRLDIPGLKDNTATQGYEGDSAVGNGLLDSRYKVGRPGANTLKTFNYKQVGYKATPGADVGVDKVNATDIIQVEKDAGGVDFIKCIIRAVETSTNAGTPHESILVFRAFLTSFTDSVNANYADHTYVGRGEKFYTYQNADRKVGFQLAIAAQSRAEMKPLYRKLNYLMSQLYPEYSGLSTTATGNGFMRSPLVKLTIGDYFYNTPGILTSMNISVPDDAPWELESSNQHNGTTNGVLSTEGDMYQLPHYLTVALQFTPIHNFIPRRALATTVTKTGDTSDNKNYYIPPFITPHENATEFYGSLAGKNRFNIG